MRAINVSKNVWKRLVNIRKQLDLKHTHQVIKYLIETKESTQSLLDKKTIDELIIIKDKNGLKTIDETIWKMINWIRQNKPIIDKYQKASIEENRNYG